MTARDITPEQLEADMEETRVSFEEWLRHDENEKGGCCLVGAANNGDEVRDHLINIFVNERSGNALIYDGEQTPVVVASVHNSTMMLPESATGASPLPHSHHDHQDHGDPMEKRDKGSWSDWENKQDNGYQPGRM